MIAGHPESWYALPSGGRAMSAPALSPWTIDQFFAWQFRQPERNEFVGGFPVRMMAGT